MRLTSERKRLNGDSKSLIFAFLQHYNQGKNEDGERMKSRLSAILTISLATTIFATNAFPQSNQNSNRQLGSRNISSGQIKVGAAYICKSASYAQISRIFLADGTVFEQWNKKENQSAPDENIVAKWAPSSGTEGYRISFSDVVAIRGDRFFREEKEDEQFNAGTAAGQIRVLTGGKVVMHCVEISSEDSSKMKQAAQAAAKHIQKKLDADYTSRTGGLCTKPTDLATARAEAMNANTKLWNAIRDAESGSPVCSGRAKSLARHVSSSEIQFEKTRQFTQNDPGTWRTYCNFYALQFNSLSNCR